MLQERLCAQGHLCSSYPPKGIHVHLPRTRRRATRQPSAGARNDLLCNRARRRSVAQLYWGQAGHCCALG